MYVYNYVCLNNYTHMYVCIYIYIRMCVCVCAKSTRLILCMYVCSFVCLDVLCTFCLCMCVSIYIMQENVYICIMCIRISCIICVCKNAKYTQVPTLMYINTCCVCGFVYMHSVITYTDEEETPVQKA